MTRRTRSEAIQMYCRSCVGDGPASSCDLQACSLWRFRAGAEQTDAPGKRLTRSQAVRAFCIDCMGGQVQLVGRCTAPGCDLFRYRMGREVLMEDAADAPDFDALTDDHITREDMCA